MFLAFASFRKEIAPRHFRCVLSQKFMYCKNESSNQTKNDSNVVEFQSTNELIPIEEKVFNGEQVNSVNARELHTKLEVNSKFADWIKNRLVDFVENRDYLTISKNLENGGRTLDYFLTLDTAKHIAMIERNEQGRAIRDYFIAKEKEAKEKAQCKIPQNPIQLLEFALDSLKESDLRRKEAEKNLYVVKNANHQLQQIVGCENDISLSACADILHLHPKKFIDRLHDLGYIKKSQDTWFPCTTPSAQGLFKLISFSMSCGSETKHRQQTKVTPKGVEYLRNKMAEGKFDDIKHIQPKQEVVKTIKLQSIAFGDRGFHEIETRKEKNKTLYDGITFSKKICGRLKTDDLLGEEIFVDKNKIYDIVAKCYGHTAAEKIFEKLTGFEMVA